MHASTANGNPVSTILAELARTATGERVYLRELVEALGDRAFGLLLLIFALPNAVGLGTIPGVSTVFGVPQIILALQMVLGLQRPWLPRWLLDKSIARADFMTIVERSTPYLHRFERVLRPRWLLLSSALAERLLGVLFAVLATIVSLPIPFGNQPPAAAIAFIALGLIGRDGIYILIGLAAACFAVILAGAVVIGGAEVVLLVLRRIFGG